MVWMPDYGHAARPSTYLAVAGSCHRQTLTNEFVGCPFFQFQQTADPPMNASRQNREDARGKTGAAFWFWETDDDDRADLRHLIEIREQFDLIMIGTEDVGFE